MVVIVIVVVVVVVVVRGIEREVLKGVRKDGEVMEVSEGRK